VRHKRATLTMIVRGIAAPNRVGDLCRLGARLLRSEGGVSALEFSLIAPIVLIGLVSVADLAFMAQQHMAVDHVLRAGAQEAMQDKSTDATAPEIMKVLNLMAADSFAVGSTQAVNGKPPLTLYASRYCVCPDDINRTHLPSCSTVCTGSKSPLAFYEISAESKVSNMILPQVSLRPKLQVQVR